jgi:selenide,water dikinase
VGERVQFVDIPFAMEEVLFDPQTSGGLLIALGEEEAPKLLAELQGAGLPANIVGRLTEQQEQEITVLNTAK